MEKNVRICDNPGCKKTEEQANHWYKLLLLEGAVTISRVGEIIDRWKDAHAGEVWKDACGRKCGMEMVAAWMGKDDPV